MNISKFHFHTSVDRIVWYCNIMLRYVQIKNLFKFLIFIFHSCFHCLLSLENLEILNANMDTQKNLLITHKCDTKINYYKEFHSIHHYDLKPKS